MGSMAALDPAVGVGVRASNRGVEAGRDRTTRFFGFRVSRGRRGRRGEARPVRLRRSPVTRRSNRPPRVVSFTSRLVENKHAAARNLRRAHRLARVLEGKRVVGIAGYFLAGQSWNHARKDLPQRPFQIVPTGIMPNLLTSRAGQPNRLAVEYPAKQIQVARILRQIFPALTAERIRARFFPAAAGHLG